MNGLDLFSGIGGIGLALEPWVRTVAYCEREPYAQGVLLSRMQSGDIDRAPIWDDVTTLRGDMLPRIDIISGGFPCQDISVAGLGKGLAGERSGLFFEIARLVRECQPRFVFLENVPAIRTRGGERVNWPRSGMTVGGQLYQPQQLEPHTNAKDGFYLPTPTATQYGRNKSRKGNKERPSLDTMARKNLWPTPCARDYKDQMSQEKAKGQFQKRESPSLAITIIQKNGGQLSPMWVEWLMGYRIGHTELNAWATAWFRSKSGKPSKN
ncbi:MAG: DNA cytosine methyltransferase [Gammaproteobacteria bacterium]|nr:DNA cytosine methyltransferase [Gammaproteobacteria bacterium]